MKRYILFLFFISLQIAIFGQTKMANADDFTVASYRGKDLVSELAKNIHQPDDSFTKEMEGDVILRVLIDQNGKLQDPVCNYAATVDLGKSAIAAINNLNNDWEPTLRKGNPISKSYLIIFRYRIKGDNKSSNSITHVNKKIRKEKYDQALSLINNAIADNDFDAKNFLKRAEIFTLMNLEEKARADLNHAEKLQSAVLAIVDFELIKENNISNSGILVISRVPSEAFRVKPKSY